MVDDKSADNDVPAGLTPITTDGDKADAPLITESEHWPALYDSVRGSAKSGLPDAFKSLSIGSPMSPQTKKVGTENEASVNSMPKQNPPPQSPTNTGITRQNSINRVGGNSGRNMNKGVNSKLVDGGNAQVQSAPGSPSILSNSGSTSSIGESSGDNNSRKNAGQRNDQQPFRRSHSGPLFRGDNRGNAHQDRRRKDWGSRSFGRENQSQQPTVGYRPTSTRGPSPAPTPYVYPTHPVALQPFNPQMVYHGIHAPHLFFMPHHPDFQRPQVPMIPPMPFSVPDPDLSSEILKQIEYYFSDDNLVKDWFLRKQMDGEGWVPIKLVAGFPKVAHLTDNIQLIMEALRASNAVEVQGDKLRRKTDWARWIPRS